MVGLMVASKYERDAVVAPLEGLHCLTFTRDIENNQPKYLDFKDFQDLTLSTPAHVHMWNIT